MSQFLRAKGSGMDQEETGFVRLIDLIERNKAWWAIQVLQNNLALYGMVPLRLCDAAVARKVHDALPDSLNRLTPEDWAQGPRANLDPAVAPGLFSLPSSWGFATIPTPWLREPSYPHPFWHDLQASARFRTWEHGLSASWLAALPVGSGQSVLKLIGGKLIVAAQRLRGVESEWLLVAGPVFVRPVEPSSGPEVHEDTFKPLAAELAAWAWAETDRISLRERCESLVLQCSMRSWWGVNELKHRLARSASALEGMLQSGWSTQRELERGACKAMVVGSRLLYSKTMDIIHAQLIHACQGEPASPAPYEILFPLASHEDSLLRAWKEEDHWRMQVEPCERKLRELLVSRRSGFLAEGASEIAHRQAGHDLSGLYSSYESRLVSLEASHNQERLQSLFHWFRREYEFVVQESSRDEWGRICCAICRTVAHLLTADVCTLYYYNYEEGVLRPIGYHPAGDRNFDDVRATLPEVGKDRDRRSQSISYRAFDSEEARFCRASWQQREAEETIWVFKPDCEKMIMDPPHPYRCAIDVPLRVHGRAMGVLEVAGFSLHQFRWENRQLLQRVAGLISPLLYQRFITWSLARVTREVLSAGKSEIEQYGSLCESLSRLFMAYASALWQPSETNPQTMTLRGGSNRRKALPGDGGAPPEAFEFDLEDQSSLYRLAFAGRESAVFSSHPTADLLATPGWLKGKPYRQWLKAHQIQAVTLVRIRAAQKGDLLGLLSLYYQKESEALGEAWERTICVMADRVALLLEALAGQREFQKDIDRVLNHQLKQYVDTVFSRARDIYEGLQGHLKGDPSDIWVGPPGARSRADLVFKDLRTAFLSLQRLMKRMVEARTGGKLPRLWPELNPIHEAFLFDQGLVYERSNWEIIPLRRAYRGVISPTWRERQNRNLGEEYDEPLEDSPSIYMDPEHLGIILKNLVDNAVKYAPLNSPIEAKGQRTRYGVEFRLSNRAACLQEGEELQIFRPGYRGSNAEHMEGDGMGLYIAKTLCQIYQGDLSVEVEPAGKQGWFTFTLFMPRHKDAKP